MAESLLFPSDPNAVSLFLFDDPGNDVDDCEVGAMLVIAVGAALVLATFSFGVVPSVDDSDRLAMCSGLVCAVESVGAVELVVETLFSLEVGMLEA